MHASRLYEKNPRSSPEEIAKTLHYFRRVSRYSVSESGRLHPLGPVPAEAEPSPKVKGGTGGTEEVGADGWGYEEDVAFHEEAMDD